MVSVKCQCSLGFELESLEVLQWWMFLFEMVQMEHHPRSWIQLNPWSFLLILGNFVSRIRMVPLLLLLVSLE